MTLTELLTKWRNTRPESERSEAACGAALFVGQSTFGAWLRGVSLPSKPRLRFLAERLGVPLEELTCIVQAERAAKGGASAGIDDQAPSETDEIESSAPSPAGSDDPAPVEG